MDWRLIIQHAVSGYIIVAPCLSLYFIFLNNKGSKPICTHVLLSFLFCAYLVGLLAVTGIWWLGSFSPNMALVPVIHMIKAPLTNALNAILFFPLGFFLPIVYKNFNAMYKVILMAFVMSISVEFFQMFGCGTTDIDDLIMNTLGAGLGYCLYKFMIKMGLKTYFKKVNNNNATAYCEAMFCWGLSLLSMITVQTKIFYFLF